MVLAWLILILLFTAPIWILVIGVLALKKLNDRPSKLSPEEREKIWEETLNGG